MANSADLFEQEGPYPKFDMVVFKNNKITSTRDNYTDAWMLLTAAYDGGDNIVDLAMSNYRYQIGDLDPTQTLVQHYKYGKEFSDNSVIMYGRYWSGYLLAVKPLLYCFDYYVVRYINIIFQTILFGAIVLLLVKKEKSI